MPAGETVPRQLSLCVCVCVCWCVCMCWPAVVAFDILAKTHTHTYAHTATRTWHAARSTRHDEPRANCPARTCALQIKGKFLARLSALTRCLCLQITSNGKENPFAAAAAATARLSHQRTLESSSRAWQCTRP